jgi:NAD(P)-dependent dehydrogenase (short-subunit alcohol dehydrogenase family)
MQFGVNHPGHFALTAGLMPLLRSTAGSRVVTVSSMGHRLGHLALSDPMFERRRYGRWTAYYQSKLANILFARELERRLELDRATTSSLAAHPGGTNTDLGSEGTSLTNRIIRAAYPLATMPVEQGALPILRAAVDPSARGGEFYGPHLVAVGRPVRETPSRRARDATAGRGLWELSERLTGEPLL